MYAVGLVYLLGMHVYVPNLGGSGLDLPFNAIIWGGLSIALGLGFYQTAVNRQLRYSKLTIALFLCCLMLSVPLFYPSTQNYTQAIPRIAALWGGWIFFLVLQQLKLSNPHKQRLLWFIVLAVVIETLIAYLQYFQLLPKELLGNNAFTSSPFGVFQKPGVMVSFISTGLVLSGYLLARQQRKYGQKISRTILLYLMPLIAMPIIILLTIGLEWLVTAVGFFVIATYLYRFSTPRRFSGWIASTVAGTGVGLILLSSANIDLNTSEHEQWHQTVSQLYPQSLDMFIEKPFTGYGYGQFEPEYILYTARQHQLNPSYLPGIPSTPYPMNEPLYWGVEGGLIPVLGIVLAALLVLIKIYSARKGTRLAIFSLFIPIILHNLIGAPFYQSAILWITFVILLFWVDQRTANYKLYNITKASKIAIRSGSFILPTLVIALMASALQSNVYLLRYANSYPRDTLLLEQILSPITQQQEYEWQLNKANLRQGLLGGDSEMIEEYISWAISAIKKQPRTEYYSNLILAYLGLGKIDKAEQIRSEAAFLFPEHDFSKVHIAPVVEELGAAPGVEKSDSEESS